MTKAEARLKIAELQNAIDAKSQELAKVQDAARMAVKSLKGEVNALGAAIRKCKEVLGKPDEPAKPETKSE